MRLDPPHLKKGNKNSLVCLKRFSCYKCVIEGNSLGTRGWAWGKIPTLLTLTMDGALQKVGLFFSPCSFSIILTLVYIRI